MLVADLGAVGVSPLVAGAGVVDRDPGGARKPGPEHADGLVPEPGLAVVQQPPHLALGDLDAHVVQLRDQARDRHLALVVLGQHVAAQRRPEMAVHPARQRRQHGAAVGRDPALAPEADDTRANQQVPHHICLVALEPRTGRNLGLQHVLFMDGEPRRLAAVGAALASATPWRLRLARVLHAAGPQFRPALQALEPGDLVAQHGNLSAQRGIRLENLDHQPLEVVDRKNINICYRFAHGRSESQPEPS